MPVPRRNFKCFGYIWRNILFAVMLVMPALSFANGTCHGRAVNPISDICWSCLLPISIGGFSVGKGNTPKIQAHPYVCAQKVIFQCRGFRSAFGSLSDWLI